MVFFKKDGVWHDSVKDDQRLIAELDLLISYLEKRNTYIGNEASECILGDGTGKENLKE